MPCSCGCEKAQFGKLVFMGERLTQRIACVDCYEFLNSDEKIGLEWGYPLSEIDKIDPFIHPFFIGYKMDNNWERYPDRYLSIHRGADFYTRGDRAVLAVADGAIFRITAHGVYMHHENEGSCYTSYYMHVKGNPYLQSLKVEKGKEIGTMKHGINHVHLEMYRTKVNRAAESSKLYQSGQDWYYGFLRQQDTDLLNPLELITP
jgi:murein DD-endopeptidase MepM/ murein hydrolase activator NlpD